MSTDTSVPQPRMSGMDVSDSALLATLLREAPIGFAFFGTDLCFRRVNRSLARLYGRNGADHIGHPPSRVWPEPLAARAESAIRRVLADDQPLFEPDQPISLVKGGRSGEENGGGEHPGARPQARHWSFSWFPSHDPEGAISGVALIAVDVTERRNSEEAVRRSEERYRSLVQAGAQVVWVTTPTGEIAEDSPEWRWITGQTAEEYQGNGWLDAIHPEDRERVERDWRGCTATGKVFDGRYRVRTETGSYRHYDVRAVPIERDGKIVEWVGASTDVTGQREAEEMRGRLTEQLSAAALRTVRLQQATSMLAEAITVEQVVEVITEVGRSAIGAERSAVAMLDPERLRLRTVNLAGLPDSPGSPTGDMPLDVPSVMTMVILDARYLPVTRNMEIGGDWYDAFRLPDGKLAVAAGDVMGKGLTAAAGMGRVRNALRALALTDPRPAAVLAGLDRLFTATELDEQVTTVAYLVVDPVTGEGLAGNAGHLPPLLLSSDSPPRLDPTEAGTPLGWSRTAGAASTPAWTNWWPWRHRRGPGSWKIPPDCWSTW